MRLTKTKRLKELILYVAGKSAKDDSFGLTKLNKLLFFSDFQAYGVLGESITGQDYIKLAFGPAPKAMLPVLGDMEGKDCKVGTTDRYGFRQTKVTALRDPDLSVFTADQLALVDGIIGVFWGVSAIEISNFSHRFVGWEVTGDKAVIPYTTYFVDPDACPTEEDLAFARVLAGNGSCHGAHGDA